MIISKLSDMIICEVALDSMENSKLVNEFTVVASFKNECLELLKYAIYFRISSLVII